MLHPLDEIAPIVCKPGGNTSAFFPFLLLSVWIRCPISFYPVWFLGHFEGSRVQYASDATMTIVFSCCQPSLVVSYDTVQAIHSVWVLRKVTCDVRDLTHAQMHKHKCLRLYSISFTTQGAFVSVAVPRRSSRNTVTSDGVRISDLSPS